MRQKRERALASVRETAEGLAAAGVMSTQTMREFDELYATPIKAAGGQEESDTLLANGP